ncbi:MAG: hypothetical protein R3C17_02845 [Planctomycetaceae bacterium]
MVRILILQFALVLLLSISLPVQAQSAKVDSCDVTWLWPVPANAAAADALISMDDLKSSDGNPVWSDKAFTELLAIIDSNASAVKVSANTSRKIGLLPEFRNNKAWKIAAVRIDPTAPGGDEKLREQFGEIPQIRLIVQPVTVTAGMVTVHDFASHVVFSYVTGVDGTKKLPNRDKFKSILSDVQAIKKLCGDKGVQTTGAKLGVHPGLVNNAVPEFTAKAKELLQKHLDASHLSAMAMMGLQNPEPWIFVATFQPKPTDPFQALPIPVFTDPGAASPADKIKTAEMLTFRDTPHIQPVPHTNNRNPATAVLSVLPAQRRGVSTSPLFEASLNKDASALIGTDAAGQAVFDAELKNKDLADWVANPAVSHFFNTDCVSCHTESQRRTILNLPASSFAFKWPDGVAPMDPAVAQKQRWNVHNIGWFPDTFGTGMTSATISQRTANETAEVVKFVNEKYLTP